MEARLQFWSTLSREEIPSEVRQSLEEIEHSLRSSRSSSIEPKEGVEGPRANLQDFFDDFVLSQKPTNARIKVEDNRDYEE